MIWSPIMIVGCFGAVRTVSPFQLCSFKFIVIAAAAACLFAHFCGAFEIRLSSIFFNRFLP